MQYIDNFALSILIYFLRNKQSLTLNYYYDDYSKEELQTYFQDVNNFLICNLNTSSNNVIEYKMVLSATMEVSFTDHAVLESYLQNYIQQYKNGDLKENGNIDTFERFECLHDELVQLVENKKTNRKRCKLSDIKFAPIILENYLSNNAFIKDIIIETISVEESLKSPIRIFKYTSSGKDEWDGIYDNWQYEYFNCLYELDMDWYLNKYKKSKTKLVKMKTEYPEQQRKIYSEIVKCVKNHQYFIGENVIRNVLNASYDKKGTDILNNAVKELNKCYREINNINDTKVYLIKKQRNEYVYKILKDFTPQ